MYIPQPVKVNLREGVVETAGGIRKMTVVFMELLDVDIAVSDNKDTLHEVGSWRPVRVPCAYRTVPCRNVPRHDVLYY